jgi:hypothetical protein
VSLIAKSASGDNGLSGDSGLDIEKNDERSQASISITAPVVRKIYQYLIADRHCSSADKGSTLVKSSREYFKSVSYLGQYIQLPVC